MEMDWSPLFLSLKIAIAATCIIFFLGITAARLCMGVKGHLKWILDVFLTLPLVMPPTVVGFVLLLLLGKNGWIGRWLATIDITIIFTPSAAIIAAVVVAFPLMYRTAKGAFEQVNEDILWAARTLGLSEWKIFICILIPEAWPGILSGLILAFSRALGEFGATLMIAGNIPGVTQTIPLSIYFATGSGKTEVAFVWSIIITVLSCVMLWGMNYCNRR